MTESFDVRYPNPLSVPWVQALDPVAVPVLAVVCTGSVLASVGSLAFRYRRGDAADAGHRRDALAAGTSSPSSGQHRRSD